MDLAEANLLIAAEASPGDRPAAALAQVNALAAPPAPRASCARCASGFRGDGDDYDDPRNSFLDQVLVRRRGLPIALATLTLAVARRVGTPMAGIGLPGHFVVADLSGPSRCTWTRSTDGARLLAECARIVGRTTGLGCGPSSWRPRRRAAILARTLANLRASYLRRRMLEDALWTVELGLMVQPGRRGALPGDRGAGCSRGRALRRGGGRRRGAAGGLARHAGAAAVEAQLAAVRDLRRRMN